MKKLNFLGIGPKIAVILLPWLGVSIVLSCIHIEFFKFSRKGSDILFIAGIVLLVIGLCFLFFNCQNVAERA